MSRRLTEQHHIRYLRNAPWPSGHFVVPLSSIKNVLGEVHILLIGDPSILCEARTDSFALHEQLIAIMAEHLAKLA